MIHTLIFKKLNRRKELLKPQGSSESHPYYSRLPIPQPNQTLISNITMAAAVKSLQSRLTLCNPIDGSPPGSPVPGILQARTLEWVAISFSNA